MAFEIAIIPCRVGELNNYGYLVRNDETGAVFSIDAPEYNPLKSALTARKWSVNEVLITHHHHDHVEAIEDFRNEFGAKIIGSKADRERIPSCDRYVEDTETVTVAGAKCQIIDSSGHTINHLSFYFPDQGVVFTGDSLMACGCGRLFEGTPAMMHNTFQKFAKLPKDTLVYSGHEYSDTNLRFARSIDGNNPNLAARHEKAKALLDNGKPTVPVSIEEEMKTNPFFRTNDPDLKATLGLESADEITVFAEIRALRDRFL